MTDPDGPPHDLRRLIEVLERHHVEYLIVGGAAAGAYGAVRPTADADCVVRRSHDNLERLAAALRELNARLRVASTTTPRRSRPSERSLQASGSRALALDGLRATRIPHG